LYRYDREQTKPKPSHKRGDGFLLRRDGVRIMSIENNNVPRYDPGEPNTATLEQRYVLSEAAHVEIANRRKQALATIHDPAEKLLAVVGPCALTSNPEQISSEGMALKELEAAYEGLMMVHRLPVWKPRTDPKDWHGLETTEPEAAYRILANQADTQANVAIETGHYDHIMRYGQLLTVAWTGGRNVHKEDLIEALAIHDPSLLLLVKNGLDGSLETALKRVHAINTLREQSRPQSALIYRGGSNAQTPEAWEREYKRAIEKTGGRLVVDVAHGSEIAHDPESKKSVKGQIKALEHVIELASSGYVPAGIMIEASDTESPTDPVMPLHIALDGVQRLYEIKTGIRNQEQDEVLAA
jgi:phospho-2-dehydro-3-deoxyheptonate aldolase